MERPRESGGDLQRVHALVRGKLLVGGQKVAGRRLRGRRQLRRSAEARVELLRAHLDVVLAALVAEANVERHHAPVREPLRRLRKVGRRVDDDRCVLDAQRQ